MAVSSLVPAATGPTLSEITTAITTNAAPASVTNASIATQVANNAPSPNGWVFLGGGSLASAVSATVSFSAYKKLRIVVSTVQRGDSADYPSLRLNGDSGTNYAYARKMEGFPSYYEYPANTSYFQFSYGAISNNQHSETIIDVDFASMTNGWKSVVWECTGASQAVGAPGNWEGIGVYRGTSAITSVTIYNAGGTTFGTSATNAFHVYGAN